MVIISGGTQLGVFCLLLAVPKLIEHLKEFRDRDVKTGPNNDKAEVNKLKTYAKETKW